MVRLKWAGIDQGQGVSFSSGFAVGIPTEVAESFVGLVEMALSPIQTYRAMKDIINSENALGKITDTVKQDYINRINKLESEYQKAGVSGSYKAGLEAGKLTANVASLFAGGLGVAKGAAVLTEKMVAKFVVKASDPIQAAGAANKAWNSIPTEWVLKTSATKMRLLQQQKNLNFPN